MIHLIVGNTGSGKTTYSNELKRMTKGIIFSIDKIPIDIDKKDNSDEKTLDILRSIIIE